MKKSWILVLIVLMISMYSATAFGANVSQHLSSRFTIMSAKLYQQVSELCPGENQYKVALLPIMDVNGEKPQLAKYLQKRMEEVVGYFPSIRLAPGTDVLTVWTELKALGLSNQDIVREIGLRLDVPAVLLTSMVTHPTHYTLSGIVFNTKTLEQRQLEVVILDRTILDSLSDEEIGLVLNISTVTPENPTTKEPSTSVEPRTPDNSTINEPEPQEPVNTGETAVEPEPSTGPENIVQEPNTVVDAEPVDSTKPVEETEPEVADNTDMVDVITEIIANAPQTPVETTPPAEESKPEPVVTTPANPVTQGPAATPGTTPGSGTTTPGKSTENQKPVEPIPPVQVTNPEPAKPVTPTFLASFVRKSESPLLNNLLLGFDLGDLNGDGKVELIYCGGMNIQVRSLENYEKLWDFAPFRPSSKDYTVMTVDLDGDKNDEIIYHGNLLKLVENQLVSQQPRFLSRPVSLYGKTGVTLYNDNAAFIVNYQGLVKKEYPIGGVGKRFLFTDLEGDGKEELVVVYDGEEENSKVKVFQITENGAENPVTLEGVYGYSLIALDLNKNGRPELYFRRNFFNGVTFLFSKIYAFESVDGKLTKIAESEKLDYFIVDFAQYPKTKPDSLVLGTMNLQSKQQSITEIQSKLFFYTLTQ